jgi:hypothetical protein
VFPIFGTCFFPPTHNHYVACRHPIPGDRPIGRNSSNLQAIGWLYIFIIIISFNYCFISFISFNLGNTLFRAREGNPTREAAKMNQWMAKVNEMKQLRQAGATSPTPASTAAGPRK